MLMNILHKKRHDVDEIVVLPADGYTRYVIPATHIVPSSVHVEVREPWAIVRAVRSLPPQQSTHRERSLRAIERRILLPVAAISEQMSAQAGNYSVTLNVPLGDDEGTAPPSHVPVQTIPQL